MVLFATYYTHNLEGTNLRAPMLEKDVITQYKGHGGNSPNFYTSRRDVGECSVSGFDIFTSVKNPPALIS